MAWFDSLTFVLVVCAIGTVVLNYRYARIAARNRRWTQQLLIEHAPPVPENVKVTLMDGRVFFVVPTFAHMELIWTIEPVDWSRSELLRVDVGKMPPHTKLVFIESD